MAAHYTILYFPALYFPALYFPASLTCIHGAETPPEKEREGGGEREKERKKEVVYYIHSNVCRECCRCGSRCTRCLGA